MTKIFIREKRAGYFAMSHDGRCSAFAPDGVVNVIKACASKATGIPVDRLTARPNKSGQYTEVPVDCWWTVEEKTK